MSEIQLSDGTRICCTRSRVAHGKFCVRRRRRSQHPAHARSYDSHKYSPTQHFKLQNWTIFLPRDARSVKRGIAIVSRPSVRLSVTLTYRGQIGCTSSKLITRVISLGYSLLGATTSAIWSKGNIPKIWVEKGWGRSSPEPTTSLKRGKIEQGYY